LRRLVALLAVVSAVAFAHDEPSHRRAGHEYPWGRPGEAAAASRTIRVEMSDALRYSPDHLQVKRGETVRFIVRNAGKLPHELVLGSEKELREHAKAMREHPDMQHDDPYMVQVPPGATREMAWTFSKAGRLAFGCLVPGHWEGGMKGEVVVTP
jgi:uncharacterized cupredoxin-like copper-binding protein